MPELPEVETIKRGLEKAILGKKIAKIEILRGKSFQGNPEEVLGKKIIAVHRRAKLLIIQLTGDIFLVIHLKLTGQLIYKSKKPRQSAGRQKAKSKIIKITNKKSPYDVDKLPNKYTRVIIEFADQSKLFFNDLRVFGWIKVIKSKTDLNKIIDEKYGPEPFSKEFSLEYFKEILSHWGRPVKLLLMDQKKIAGIGNIYANEALFCAGIAHHHRGRDLARDHPEKVAKLYNCLKKVLQLGIRHKGATALDEAFRTLEGERGGMDKYLKVYGKEGKDCPNQCGKKIRRMTLAGRGTYFCPRCQR